MVYGMAWLASHSIWYGLAGNGMVYGMAWRARHGIWHGLACMTLFIVLPDVNCMVCIMAWRE